MSDGKSNPPSRAIWLLQNACPGDNEALTGDLIERFREGQTRGWFWQVLIAFAQGILSEIRRHWPRFCYAIAGVTMPAFLGKSVHGARLWFHWSSVPWPWSQLFAEAGPTAVLALAALPVLAAGLVINRAFRWVSLLRTGVINLALITLGHYMVDIFPWLLRPIPGDRYHNKTFIIPGSLLPPAASAAVLLVCLYCSFPPSLSQRGWAASRLGAPINSKGKRSHKTCFRNN
jgi:hypothetical protein